MLLVYWIWRFGAAYALEFIGVIGAIPFANAIATVAAGGVIVATAYQGYSSWNTLNKAMANAYSII
ncbi:hypothetical protein [Paenibacillus sp. IHBB 10380]|uniref:hypothetical protein n=1 Tax=Paenibacillus sp. IHBB 10380 TaxID=1566358 RepID=UPI0005CFE843|nr:hypothetical protein [Paenibacillus sp. IHBB 10380]AJS59957.1 hypothetical protein UB51_17425 [Paenibacillus sp. IHBB 10380]